MFATASSKSREGRKEEDLASSGASNCLDLVYGGAKPSYVYPGQAERSKGQITAKVNGQMAKPARASRGGLAPLRYVPGKLWGRANQQSGWGEFIRSPAAEAATASQPCCIHSGLESTSQPHGRHVLLHVYLISQESYLPDGGMSLRSVLRPVRSFRPVLYTSNLPSRRWASSAVGPKLTVSCVQQASV